MTSPILSALRAVAVPLAVPLAVFGAAAPSAAQPRPDPLDATAPIPPLRYSASLQNYRALGDDVQTPWKEANETAARIGGWRAYAREARAPAAAASAPAASADKK